MKKTFLALAILFATSTVFQVNAQTGPQPTVPSVAYPNETVTRTMSMKGVRIVKKKLYLKDVPQVAAYDVKGLISNGTLLTEHQSVTLTYNAIKKRWEVTAFDCAC